MLLSKTPNNSNRRCSFDPNDCSLNTLNSVNSWGNEDKGIRCSSDFGSWVVTAPRKRKNRHKTEHLSLETKTERNNSTSVRWNGIPTHDYYKRYRVDPLEGTFKHYKNMEQYMQLYRESNTLCFKQKSLNELSTLYSSSFDINNDRAVSSINGYTYSLDPEAVGKWEAASNMHAAAEEFLAHPLTIPPITSRSEGGIPLMLLPNAPSIPHRLSNTQITRQVSQTPISQASFMCNAYMNKNIVCPVHRLIHRRSSLLNRGARLKIHMSDSLVNHESIGTEEHIKVTLPGIPKPRYTSQVKRLKALRDAHPVIGMDSSTSLHTHSSPDCTGFVLDEGEESSDARINLLLSSPSSNSSPCDRISKALQNQQQRRAIPSMQLPVTALLQYHPTANSKTRHPKRKPLVLSLKSRQKRAFDSLDKRKGRSEPIKPKPEVKQLMNYEKEYEKFFSDVLESKGRSMQRKHFQSLTKTQEVKK